MADKSKIDWCDATWNPVTGCSKVSAGCKNCYAERDWTRLSANPKTVYYGRKFTNIMCHPERLDQPLRWTKPRRIFVNSMSDLFHEDVPDEFISEIFAVMALAPRHTFQILTKRAARMQEYLDEMSGNPDAYCFAWAREMDGATSLEVETWPLPNVWLGVSCEDQKNADERIPLLLQTPAAVRFISAEPLLGEVDLWANDYLRIHRDTGGYVLSGLAGLNLVIAGGESGPNARPSHPGWFRSLRDQCKAADVPYFFKQWGEWEIASNENGHYWGVMPNTNEKYTWVGNNGKTFNPSAPEGLDCYAMAKVGKKSAGRLLDGVEHNEYPA